jgi:2-polyprenyl-3-methyl-5-hydroxy-6-metoxy-1,4-benzoquinol methylase
MSKINYKIQYEFWHSESNSHEIKMINWQKRMLENVVPNNRESKILDIGCGFGYSLSAMRELGFNDLTGIEISEEQASVAKKKFSNIIISDNTIEVLNSIENKYSFVILFDVLEHIEVSKQIDFLKSIKGVLADGGQLYISTPNANSIIASRWRYNDYTHYCSFTEHSLNFVLLNAGFKNIEYKSTIGPGVFPKRFWTRRFLHNLKKWIIRYLWYHIFLVEIDSPEVKKISFDLNLIVLAK